MVISKAFFSKGMGAFCRKSGGSQKRECPSPYHCPPAPRHFERSEKSSLHNGQADERQMRSSRSTHAILSLPHKYRVPLRRKRSLGSARDDDTRERAISHSLSFLHVEGCPCGADLSSAFGAPLLQGATQQSCKNADPSQGLLPHIVISSEARNLPCTTIKRRASDEEQPKHLGDFIITS